MHPDKLVVSQGIAEAQVKQLIHYANTDLQVRKFTSDPKRFLDKEEYQKWRKKDRTIYTLSDDTGELFGIVWFGEEEMPEKEFTEPLDRKHWGITFAIRMYGDARGKRLSNDFTGKAVDMYKSSADFQKPVNKGIWLETHKDNIPALNSYRKSGFRQVSNPDEKGRVLMILEK